MIARILAYLVVGFLIGVFVRSLIEVPLLGLAVFLAGALICIALSYVPRFRMMVIGAFVLTGIVIGVVRTDRAIGTPNPFIVPLIGEKVSIEGFVSEEPDVREGSTRLTVDVAAINDAESSTRILVVAPPYAQVRYGDVINAVGTIKRPESFESGMGRSFNYPKYLAVRGIQYEMSYAQVSVQSHGGNPLKRTVIAIKSIYINGLRAVLPEPYAGLAAGITAGDKRSVGKELSDIFQRVSLVHILVLSGYNITVVLGALMGVFARLSRGARLIAVLSVVLFFVVVAGGAASAARAGAMAFAAVYAKLYGRMFLALRVLIAVVFLMVLWNPPLLTFDPGFQLSVLATLGLIVFSSHITRWLSWIPERLQLREIAAATIATQVTVLPVLLYQNGSLSIVSLPANLLALVAVPLAMAFSAVAALSGVIFGTWGTILALPAYVLLRYIIAVADVFASLPFASMQIPAFSAWWLLVTYALLGAMYLYIKKAAELGSAAISTR